MEKFIFILTMTIICQQALNVNALPSPPSSLHLLPTWLVQKPLQRIWTVNRQQQMQLQCLTALSRSHYEVGACWESFRGELHPCDFSNSSASAEQRLNDPPFSLALGLLLATIETSITATALVTIGEYFSNSVTVSLSVLQGSTFFSYPFCR